MARDATPIRCRAHLGAVGVKRAIGGIGVRRALLRLRDVGDLARLYGGVERILPGLRHRIRIGR